MNPELICKLFFIIFLQICLIKAPMPYYSIFQGTTKILVLHMNQALIGNEAIRLNSSYHAIWEGDSEPHRNY